MVGVGWFGVGEGWVKVGGMVGEEVVEGWGIEVEWVEDMGKVGLLIGVGGV